MKVNNIKDYAERFKTYLKSEKCDALVYKYENLKNFRAHWDIEDLDLAETFDKSFKSQLSNELWGGSVNSAKSQMLAFLKNDKAFARAMFKDLFNDQKDLAMRISRFNFHLDQLLDILHQKNDKINAHYHTQKTISVYLCFNDPSQYCIVEHDAFSKMLRKLEAKSIPEEYELERALKLCKGLFTLLSKDEELVALHSAFIPDKYRCEPNMLLVHDYYTICSTMA